MPVHGAADPRRNPGAAREGVRRGRGRAGQGAAADHVPELLPNIISTIIVFFTLNIANNMLLESALSFLGAGVRPPNASWGTMIADGYQMIYTAPQLTIVPGLMIVADGAVAQRVRRRPARRARSAGQDQAGALRRWPASSSRRLLGMVAVLFAISVIVFLIFNVIPNSDPAASASRARTPTRR